MPDPSKLYAHLPDAYDRHASSDQYRLMSALEAGFTSLRTKLTSWKNERAITTATGDGLTRKVESVGLFRPPGMNDTQLRAVAKAIFNGRRCTLATIKEVFEAATGIDVDVNDIQTDATKDRFKIYVSPATGSVWPSHGRGFYPDITTEIFYSAPLRSALAGPVLDALGVRGAFINDHAWYPVSIWTMILLDKVRPAGTKYVFEGL